MKTELAEVVKTMSQVIIPQDLIDEVDMGALLKGFRKDYKQLDNLKNTRQEHEKRNFVGRLLNKDELENAQLSAAELQASFSKKLGQLLIISVAQSQQLNSQQHELSEQQNTIKKQTERLARNDDELKEQQFNLEAQNNKLEKLVNDYFELKGLTQDGALKLIKIANDVKETRDSIVMSFDERMLEIDKIRQSIDAEHEDLVSHQTQQLSTFKIEASNRLDEHQKHMQLSIKQCMQQIAQVEEQLRQALITFEQRVSDSLSLTMQNVKQQQVEYDRRWQSDKDKIFASLSQHQQGWTIEVEHQNSKLSSLLSDYARLQQEVSEQAQLHSQEVETLNRLVDKANKDFDRKELVWNRRLNGLILSFSGAVIILAAAMGYFVYRFST
jgi:DNA repair exonuclease SbcCD ATPase subunit